MTTWVEVIYCYKDRNECKQCPRLYDCVYDEKNERGMVTSKFAW